VLTGGVAEVSEGSTGGSRAAESGICGPLQDTGGLGLVFGKLARTRQ